MTAEVLACAINLSPRPICPPCLYCTRHLSLNFPARGQAGVVACPRFRAATRCAH